MAPEFAAENQGAMRSAPTLPVSQALTVSQLNREVASVLARGFPLVRVRGELGNFTRAASGHWYFTLKDVGAQVRCAMFRTRNQFVDFKPKEGDEVELRASVTLYEARGEFQLLVESLSPVGHGRYYEEFLRLKSKLEAEGLFDSTLKRPLCVVPRRIGIVTSLKAAALRDVVTTLQRRAPHVALILYPVPVQGEGAGAQIAAMLQRVAQRAEVDTVLLVRGGGSIEDLWAFNDEAVARALRASAVPVICGVGHESDVTIADWAADLRAPTPTAAAEMAAASVLDLQETLGLLHQRLQRRVRHQLQQNTQRLDYAWRALSRPRLAFEGLRTRIAALTAHLHAAMSAALNQRRHQVFWLTTQLGVVRTSVNTAHIQVQQRQQSLQRALEERLRAYQVRIDARTQALTHLDPQQVLARGYSLTRDAAGQVVRNAAALPVGASLHTTFAHGAVVSVVQEHALSDQAPVKPSRK